MFRLPTQTRLLSLWRRITLAVDANALSARQTAIWSWKTGGQTFANASANIAMRLPCLAVRGFAGVRNTASACVTSGQRTALHIRYDDGVK